MAAKAEQCLLWLQACHEKHVHNDQHFNPCPKVAKLFAQAAADKLTDEQFEQLGRFLKDPRAADGLLVLGSWWDPESKTIKLLVEKGMKGEFTFEFDWHWRAEETFGGNCHTSQWDKKLRSLRDQLSADLLEILPLPFVVTGSACTRKSLKKTLHAKTSSLRIDLGMPEAALDFDLDFQEDGLRRIIVHVPHPTGGFYRFDDKKTGQALQLDGGIDFFLWLAGREKDPAVVLASGDSIAAAASLLIRQKISNSQLEVQRRKREERAAMDLEETDLDSAVGFQTFHGGTITVRKVGRILVDGSPLSFAIERDKARKILDLRGVPRIGFLLDNIELSVAWLAQITYELEILGVTTESSLPSANSAGPVINQLVPAPRTDPVVNQLVPAPRTGPVINQLVPAPRTGPVGGRWINAEVRKSLLEGGLFHCVQSNTHHLHQKVYVGGISFPVPKEADAKTIFIKCFLTDEGKDETWTENQPRRFLDKCPAKQRYQPTYTS
ncbi:hypothetical protein QBC33DRAFT_617011 [Phialemonium atrogriseum]|uniref:Uncharacterized protein n=1 Tax=Phialemonium atrogriseum TaxID=1093897 RepID=A0AAJ0FJG2_9PEZI|nr:uncharacterized protein QBC33DRAFT_617011 [Phialemonium atrogriseum]KAK1770606.1 hypothetical protein QBC33DRAFT_617011 [Phialemonium atrogriseum]